MRLEYVIVSIIIFLVLLAAVMGVHVDIISTFSSTLDKLMS